MKKYIFHIIVEMFNYDALIIYIQYVGVYGFYFSLYKYLVQIGSTNSLCDSLKVETFKQRFAFFLQWIISLRGR